MTDRLQIAKALLVVLVQRHGDSDWDGLVKSAGWGADALLAATETQPATTGEVEEVAKWLDQRAHEGRDDPTYNAMLKSYAATLRRFLPLGEGQRERIELLAASISKCERCGTCPDSARQILRALSTPSPASAEDKRRVHPYPTRCFKCGKIGCFPTRRVIKNFTTKEVLTVCKCEHCGDETYSHSDDLRDGPTASADANSQEHRLTQDAPVQGNAGSTPAVPIPNPAGVPSATSYSLPPQLSELRHAADMTAVYGGVKDESTPPTEAAWLYATCAVCGISRKDHPNNGTCGVFTTADELRKIWIREEDERKVKIANLKSRITTLETAMQRAEEMAMDWGSQMSIADWRKKWAENQGLGAGSVIADTLNKAREAKP